MVTYRRNVMKLRPAKRHGAALLACIVLIAITSILVVRLLDVQTAQWAAERNSADYEKALYLAGAGAHHALAILEADDTWRGTVTEGSYPANDTYSATAATGSGSNVVITATGVAGQVTRSLQVTVTFGG